MEEAIRKLMRKYDQKAEECKQLISLKYDEYVRDKNHSAISRLIAKQTAYEEAKKDIESLLDVEQ